MTSQRSKSVAPLAPVIELHTEPVYLTPRQVEETFTGITVRKLQEMRDANIGPNYFRPTPRTVLYRRDEIAEWIVGSRVKTRRA